jgi:uncharacterized OsmC-like protein
MTTSPGERVVVRWLDGVRFEAVVGDHRLLLDQPADEGGTDEGVTPLQCLAISLGSCVAYFVVRFCTRHHLRPEGLSVTVGWEYAERPHRIGELRVAIAYRGDLEPAMRERLLQVAEGCTVHHTLTHPPDIRVALTIAESAFDETAPRREEHHEPIV